MKNFSKVLATLLVLTFMLSTVSVGFAATPKSLRSTDLDVDKLVSDIQDKDVKDAVLRLSAFGIIDGMEDGKYHPETKLTREQFAKILVTSLKMDSAAKAGVGYKSFKDVPADRWSAGYIGVAAGQGLIKGYPDGNFMPAKEVSYAEAVTMLVRALGYKDEFLPGTWPGNYLAKASEKEVTKKVRFADAAGVVTRADAALLVNNTLDAKVVRVDTYEGNVIKYSESKISLLEDKLNIQKLEDRRVVANKRIDDGLNKSEIRVNYELDRKDGKTEEKEYDVVNGVNAELFLGEEVSIYLNDDDEIVYIERENDDKAYFDYVKGIKGEKLSLVKADDDYEFEKNARINVLNKDNKYELVDEVKDYEFEGKVGKFVIKNRKIVYAEVMDMGEAYPWLVVMKNDGGLLTGVSEDDNEFELDLSKDGNYDDVIVLDIDGKALSVEDIEKGNLVYAQKQSYDGDDCAVLRVVTDNIVKGKLDRVKEDRIRLDDKEIKLVKHGDIVDAYYSIDDGDDIKLYSFDSDVQDDMEDADDKEIVAYTDAVGRIAYFVTEAKATSGYKYGIVTKAYADGDRIKVYTVSEKGEGDEIVYRVEKDEDFEAPYLLDKYGVSTNARRINKETDKAQPVKNGDVIKFKLNSDGEIAKGKLFVMPEDAIWTLTDSDKDFGKDYLPEATNGATRHFSVKDDVVIINAKTFMTADDDTDDYNVVKWEKLAKSTAAGGEQFFVFCDDDNKNMVKAVIFVKDGIDKAAFDEEAIYVIDTWKKGEDVYVEYHVFGGSVETKIADVDGKVEDERAYVAKVKSNGKLELKDYSGDDFTVYFGQVTKKDSSSLTMKYVYEIDKKGNKQVIEKDKMFSISNKAVVYEEDNKKSTSNIRKDDHIYFIVEKGNNVRVVKRLTDSEVKAYKEALEIVEQVTPEDE